MPLFFEATDKPRLKPLGSHFIFDLSGPTSAFAPPRWENVRRRGVNRWLERAAGVLWSSHCKENKHVSRICSTNCCMAHFGIHLCGSKRCGLQHNTTCVVEGVTATMARGESTAWDPQSHTRGAKPCWREAVILSQAAPVETGLPLHRPGWEKERSFGRIWVRMGAHFAPWHCKCAEWLDGPRYQSWGEGMEMTLEPRSVQLCRQELDDTASACKCTC